LASSLQPDKVMNHIENIEGSLPLLKKVFWPRAFSQIR